MSFKRGMYSFDSFTLVQNSRETGKKCRAVVVMRDKTTMLYHPASSAAPPRSFKFDQSYWSHDGYRTNEHGYLEATSSKYIDQVPTFRAYILNQ